MLRSAVVFAVGMAVGMGVQTFAQPRNLVSLNHVALATEDFAGAAKFYKETMGLREAFHFDEPDGRPYLSYFQINRNTFIELMAATPDRPAGFVHVGLEVTNLDALVKDLRRKGMEVRDPSVSPRTKSRIAVARTPQGTAMELLEFGPDSLHRKVINGWK